MLISPYTRRDTIDEAAIRGYPAVRLQLRGRPDIVIPPGRHHWETIPNYAASERRALVELLQSMPPAPASPERK